MSDPIIKVKYTCLKCHLMRREFDAPARNYNEEVVKYMDRLAIAMAEDHAKQSPGCTPDNFRDVWIPVDENQPIGTEVKK